MTQTERLDYLIEYLLREDNRYTNQPYPQDMDGKKRLLRGLLNVRPPKACPPEFLRIQDEYLQIETAAKGVTDAVTLPTGSRDTRIAIWQGDITTLKVGPIITGKLTAVDSDLLANCYYSSLRLAAENNVESIAFCCISTGEFHFPNQAAAEIAVKTVTVFLQANTKIKKVIFNVFKDTDYTIYRKLLDTD